eukprot:scaffold7215_cov366-Prasinococcus_capsulatus_cf.AAC.18
MEGRSSHTALSMPTTAATDASADDQRPSVQSQGLARASTLQRTTFHKGWRQFEHTSQPTSKGWRA